MDPSNSKSPQTMCPCEGCSYVCRPEHLVSHICALHPSSREVENLRRMQEHRVFTLHNRLNFEIYMMQFWHCYVQLARKISEANNEAAGREQMLDQPTLSQILSLSDRTTLDSPQSVHCDINEEKVNLKAQVKSELTEERRSRVTYRKLIHQAIVESPEKRLRVGEIKKWIQNNYSFFLKNKPTWESTVRHILSLHSCFKRDKERFWSVDQDEYTKLLGRCQKLL